MNEEESSAVSESVTEEPSPVEEGANEEQTTEDAQPKKPEGEDEAKADSEEDAGSDGDGTEDADEPEEKPKRKNRPGKSQREIIKLRAENEQFKETVYALLRDQGGNGPGPRQEQRSGTAPEPKQDDFQDYGEYLRSHAEWVARQTVQQTLREERQRYTEDQRKRSQDQAQAQYQERLEDARDRYEDFDDVAFDDGVAISKTMADAIMESDLGPDVQYYLGRNPKEAAKIARMSPIGQVREIGKLEAKLSTPHPKKSTAAPPPPKTLAGGGKPEKDPAKMTQREYEAWRSKKAS